ncbi:MAG: PKD domain-containing protein [Candidatus Poseidoniaceae archaeon]
MHSRKVAAVLVLMLCVSFAPLASSTSARATPSCSSESATTFASQVPVDDGECVELTLGLLTPGDVYEITILVIDDALDVLVFDDAGLQPYLLGQSYRSAYQQVPSTEFANGSYEFHWKVPLSISEKSWTIVVDNLAHDGDQGNGDQGGDLGRVSISVTKLNDGQWTSYHDLVGIIPNGYLTLLEGDDLRLEEGTAVSVTAWSLEGFGDVYLQTESMNANYLAGQSNVALTGASLLGVDGTASFNWIVSAAFANQPLKLILDNTNDPDGQGDGSSNLRITIRVELVPVMRASFVAENQTVELDTLLNFDASSSPNNLQQIAQYVWDFDASVDSNNDGDAINDVDAVGVSASNLWTTPGEKTVTLTVSGQLGFDRIQTNITVLDVTDPIARITGSSTSIAGGFRIEHGETITLSCATSTDNHQVAACSWSLDGSPYGQQTIASFNWSDIGIHEVGLIVLDPSGNSQSTSVQILVTDSSVPSIDQPLFEAFSNQAVEGEVTSFFITASDNYDTNTDMRFHWDLNSLEDSDNNGNALDDPDYIGSRVDIIFDKVGTNTVIVTVFDASNNSDSRTFSVIVSEAEVVETDYAIFAVILFAGVVTMSIALIGYRRWQTTIALKLLTDRGLPENEALAHISMVKQTQRLPLFAKAIQISGLDAGGDVVSQQEQEIARKEAELQSIYGSANEPEAAPQAQFAPRMQLSQASSQAASEAAALFFEDEPKTASPQTVANDFDDLMEPQPASKPVTSGIELPEQFVPSADELPEIEEEQAPEESESNVNLLRGTCSSCSLEFQVPMPIDVKEAIVICPSCSSEQLFQR